MRSLLLFAFAFFATLWTACAQVPLPSPLPAHPRLIVSNADWDRLRAQIKTDPFSAKLYNALEKYARKILAAPPAERLFEGRRMLSTSRLVLERMTVLATVAQVSGDPVFSDRAATELRSAARFQDWNPAHYLDTAEMTLAVAIGYDWLYDRLSPEDRSEIETALLEKGINTSIDPAGPYSKWISATNNWNQVCHTGMSAAAIALADRYPDLASRVLNRAIQKVPIAGKAYAPDGVFPEGPMYWDYASAFHTLLVAAFDRFYGQAFELDTLPGFAQTPVFLLEATAPTGLCFDFSDSQEARGFSIPLFWFARHYGSPAWVQPEMEKVNPVIDSLGKPRKGEPVSRLLPFALLWRNPAHPALKAHSEGGIPLQWMGRGENPVAFHRSAYCDPSATYVAIKGGSPSLSHAHMDAGSFVLEADGVRWGLDLGMEKYNRLETMGINLWNGAQNGERWTLFRLGPEGHNILRFNGAPQNVKGSGSIVRFHGNGTEGSTVLDLSPLYSKETASVHRGVRLLPSRAVLFQDEWTAKDQPLDVVWQFVTRAEVATHPGAVELRQNGKTLTLQIVEPADAQVEVKTAQELQQPFDADNPGVSRIVLKTHTKAAQSGRFRILAIPGSCEPRPEAPKLESLLSWPAPVK